MSGFGAGRSIVATDCSWGACLAGWLAGRGLACRLGSAVYRRCRCPSALALTTLPRPRPAPPASACSAAGGLRLRRAAAGPDDQRQELCAGGWLTYSSTAISYGCCMRAAALACPLACPPPSLVLHTRPPARPSALSMPHRSKRRRLPKARSPAKQLWPARCRQLDARPPRPQPAGCAPGGRHGTRMIDAQRPRAAARWG